MGPDSSLTFRDLILRTAEAANLQFRPMSGEDNRAQIPLDPHDLDRCIRAVNDGRNDFYRMAAKAQSLRREWSFTLSPEGTGPRCVHGTPTLYAGEWWMAGGPVDEWAWSDPSFSTGGRAMRRENSDLFVLAQRDSSRRGYPVGVAAVRISDDQRGTSSRPPWAFRVFPSPDQAYILTGRFRLSYVAMTAMEHRDPAGATFDLPIAACAAARIHQHNPDLSIRDHYRQVADRMVLEALAAEHVDQPKNIGGLRDTTQAPRRFEPRENFFLESYNGIPN